MNILYVDSLEKGIGLFGGLYHVTPLTQIFHTFIFFLTGVILNITAFYPRKI
jgi:NADH-ubiquinone oxidoreductase chain 2